MAPPVIVLSGIGSVAAASRTSRSNYYGAFVLDLDGNNIEAVCHRPA